MEIKVRKKLAYGRIIIYPACEKAKLFLLMTGRKSFLPCDLDIVEKLGFTIIEETQR